MPRLDNPNIKLKKSPPFKRESLRPWDDPENFKPKNQHCNIDNSHENLSIPKNNNEEQTSKPLVNQDELIGKPIGKPLVNQDELIGKPIGKPLVNQDKSIDVARKAHWLTIGKPIGKPETNTIGKPLVNRLVNQKGTSSDIFLSIKLLTGNLLKMLIYIVEDCKTRGLLYTTPITNETFRNLLNTGFSSVKTTAQRLINRGLITRGEGKKGNGGYSIYMITEGVRNATIEIQKQLLIGKPLVNPLVNQATIPLVNHRLTDRLTETLSSSYNIINTTTTNPKEGWEIELQNYKIFGFTESHLSQLSSLGTLSASMVEQSLIEFSYDLANNATPPIKTSKINFLMGLLRSGHAYVSEGFRNEQEAAIAEMARRAEEKRKKLQEEKFLAWKASLGEDDVNKIKQELPPQLMVLHRAYGFEDLSVCQWLFDYFLRTQGGNLKNLVLNAP